MTAATPTPSVHQSRTQLLSLAVAASVVQMLMMIPGYSDNGSFETGSWLTILAISLVVSIALCLFLVPTAGAVVGVVVSVLAVASVLVFWAGVTLPLAAAAGAIGWRLRAGKQRRPAVAALALTALSVVGLVAIIISDAVAN